MSRNGKANAALAASLLFLLCSTCSAYLAFSRLETSRSWVSHTHDVQTSLSQFSTANARAGRLRTEFVDSGDVSLLPRYTDGVEKVRSEIAAITLLISDNPRQQSEGERLKQLTEERFELINRSIDLKRTGKSTLENQSLITRQLVSKSEEIDLVLQQMYAQENDLLKERQERVESSSRLTTGILLASLFLTLILFLVHHRLLTNQVHARALAETAQRALSARVLALQDQERRRFARELHDSLGQTLAVIKMAVSSLEHKLPDDAALRDCLNLLDDAIAETRTISYLLHPPMLDEAGLDSAVRWFVEGFGKRSGLRIHLDLAEQSKRLPQSVELVLFRVLQEGLTNVHRHAGAKEASVSFKISDSSAILRVKDDGCGIPDELIESIRQTGIGGGVGLSGMAERVREIGGRLEIKASAAGTEIVVEVPTRQQMQAAELPRAQFSKQSNSKVELTG